MPYVLRAVPSTQAGKVPRPHLAYGSSLCLPQTSLLRIPTSSTLQPGGFRAWRTPNHGRCPAGPCFLPWPWIDFPKHFSKGGDRGPSLPVQGLPRQLSGPPPRRHPPAVAQAEQVERSGFLSPCSQPFSRTFFSPSLHQVCRCCPHRARTRGPSGIHTHVLDGSTDRCRARASGRHPPKGLNRPPCA